MAVAVKQKRNNIAEQIMSLINSLTLKQQKELMEEVNRMARLNRINDLNNSIAPNNITMEEIVAETKAARKERDKKNAKK